MEELTHYIYRAPPTNHSAEWKNEQLWRWVWQFGHVTRNYAFMCLHDCMYIYVVIPLNMIMVMYVQLHVGRYQMVLWKIHLTSRIGRNYTRNDILSTICMCNVQWDISLLTELWAVHMTFSFVIIVWRVFKKPSPGYSQSATPKQLWVEQLTDDGTNTHIYCTCNKYKIHIATLYMTLKFYDQDLFHHVKVTALSSGFCLGSCNWIIETEYNKASAYHTSSRMYY